MARTPYLTGMACIYPVRVSESWLEHLRGNQVHSSAVFVIQGLGKSCRKDREDRIAKCRKATSKAEIGNRVNVYINCRSVLNKIDLLRKQRVSKTFISLH